MKRNYFLLPAMVLGVVGIFTNPLFLAAAFIIALTGLFIKE